MSDAPAALPPEPSADRRYLGGVAAVPPPTGVAAPLDWPLWKVTGEPTTLHVASPKKAGADAASWLRVTIGIDIRRPVRIEVLGHHDGRPTALLDLSFGTALQQVGVLLPEGVDGQRLRLRCGDDQPVYLLHPDVPVGAMRPHLLTGGEPGRVDLFLQHLTSPASLTQFGWMEGCVLDALADLADARRTGARHALDLHLDFYFPPDGPDMLRFEDFHSVRRTAVRGTETCSMFAGLARRRPDHPALDLALDYFARLKRDDGVIREGPVVAEHNMTIAYPLAAIGAAQGRGDLLDDAVRQLLAQRQHLDTSDGLYLRWYNDGRRTFRHWARGVTWYLLGMVRTLMVLDGCGHPLPSELLDDLPRLADWLMGLQRDDGLWTCFVDEPGTGPETSGSAGIAAALALAAKQGWIRNDATDAARRCFDGLRVYIQPDGLLDGMSPSNKAEAGPDVQRSGQRVMGGAASGLFGQLIAALDPKHPPRSGGD